MKKKLLLLLFGFVLATNVNAKELAKENLEYEIEKFTQKYVNNLSKKDVGELSFNEELKLTEEIQLIKEKYYGKNDSKWFNPYNNVEGFIFATLDSSTYGYNHGHIGIGAEGDNIIEANPNVGVKIYSARYADLWRKYSTGGIYNIPSATSEQYIEAMEFAEAQIGKGYSLKPWDGDRTFYCSELGYRAWEDAGIIIGKKRFGFVTPASIMNHHNTWRAFKF